MCSELWIGQLRYKGTTSHFHLCMLTGISSLRWRLSADGLGSQHLVLDSMAARSRGGGGCCRVQAWQRCGASHQQHWPGPGCEARGEGLASVTLQCLRHRKNARKSVPI